MKVLFTGGGGAGSEAIWRILEGRYEVHFGDADREAMDPSIPSERCHALPWATDPEFGLKIASLCRNLEIDLLVPGVDEELLPLACHIDDLKPARLLLPSKDYVTTMLDKYSMVEELSARNVPTPNTYLLSNYPKDFSFPCISKPRAGRGSRGVKILYNLKDAEILAADLGISANSSVLQEKIEGIEYTVLMSSDKDSQLKAIVPVRIDLKRGITIRAATDANSLVIDACRVIHDVMPAAGCYNIQLMLSPDGKVLPFEINPRVSTTFCLSLYAGIDPIAIFLSGINSDSLLPFKEGINIRRHWRNYIS